MITYSDKCIDSWSKKIIFAPNGFGKTLSSAALEKDLQAKGNHPIVFTRRKVEQLVDLKNGSIFVGETARESAENQTLIEEYQKKKILRKVLENLYGISEVEKVISKSYLFSTFA